MLLAPKLPGRNRPGGFVSASHHATAFVTRIWNTQRDRSIIRLIIFIGMFSAHLQNEERGSCLNPGSNRSGFTESCIGSPYPIPRSNRSCGNTSLRHPLSIIARTSRGGGDLQASRRLANRRPLGYVLYADILQSAWGARNEKNAPVGGRPANCCVVARRE